MNKKILALGVIGVVILVAFGVYTQIHNASRFFVIAHDPGKRSAQFSAVVLTFNKPISTKVHGHISFTPQVKYTTLIKDKLLYIYPQQLYTDNQAYQVDVSGYQATDGLIMDDFGTSFVVDSSLKADSPTQQDALVLATDAEQRNPIINKLPYDAVTWKISAVINGDVGDKNTWRDFKSNYYLRVQTYAYQGLPADQYRAKTLQFRNDALSWLRDQGADPAKDVQIKFEPSDETLGIKQ